MRSLGDCIYEVTLASLSHYLQTLQWQKIRLSPLGLGSDTMKTLDPQHTGQMWTVWYGWWGRLYHRTPVPTHLRGHAASSAPRCCFSLPLHYIYVRACVGACMTWYTREVTRQFKDSLTDPSQPLGLAPVLTCSPPCGHVYSQVFIMYSRM